MLNKLCILFFIFFKICPLYSQEIKVWTSRQDFAAGQSNLADFDFSGGRLQIRGLGGANNDFFDSANKVIWRIGYTLSQTVTAQILTLTSSVGSGAYLLGPILQSTQDDFVEVQIEPNSSNGGLLLEVEGVQYRAIIWGSGLYLNSDLISNSAALPIVLRIEKVGQSYLFGYRYPSEPSFQLARSITVASSTHAYGFGGRTDKPLSAKYSNFKFRPYEPIANWTSAPWSLTRAPSTLGSIAWKQDLPAGTRIEIQTSTSDDGYAWSAWSAPYANATGSIVSSPSAKMIRVAATLYADPTRQNSPVLDEISISYPDAVPSAPLITPLSHPQGQWASPTALSLHWSLPPGNPAPESAYQYWLRYQGVLTATASALVAEPAGQAHALLLPLPAEGAYQLDLLVSGDAASGGLTASAQTYSFGYDASPPGQVAISSATHPPLLFANNRNPVFQLSAGDTVSGVSGYAAVLDKAPTGDPGSAVNAGSELRYGPIDNGTWYLHARAIDRAGNAGPISHYGIRVDFNGELIAPDYVKALPNPVRTDQALLEYELAAPAIELSLEFLNSQGELLLKADGPSAVGKNHYTWNVAGLANGVYLFRVRARSAEDGKTYSVVRKVAVIR